VSGDGSVAGEGIVEWSAVDTCEVTFVDGVLSELGLENGGEVFGAGGEDEAGGVGIESMCKAKCFWMVSLVEEILESVEEVATAGVHGERGGFVDDDEGLVFVEDLDVGMDVGFAGVGKEVEEGLAGADGLVEVRGFSILGKEISVEAFVMPLRLGDGVDDEGEGLEEG
jgi:hypothetical protein